MLRSTCCGLAGQLKIKYSLAGASFIGPWFCHRYHTIVPASTNGHFDTDTFSDVEAGKAGYSEYKSLAMISIRKPERFSKYLVCVS